MWQQMDLEQTPVKLPASPREHGPARPTLRGQRQRGGGGGPAPSATSTPMPSRERVSQVEAQVIQQGATQSLASVSDLLLTVHFRGLIHGPG